MRARTTTRARRGWLLESKIKQIGGEIIPGTKTEIDDKHLEGGWTVKGFVERVAADQMRQTCSGYEVGHSAKRPAPLEDANIEVTTRDRALSFCRRKGEEPNVRGSEHPPGDAGGTQRANRERLGEPLMAGLLAFLVFRCSRGAPTQEFAEQNIHFAHWLQKARVIGLCRF